MDYKSLLGGLGTDASSLKEISFDTTIGQSLYELATNISQVMKSNLIEANSSNASSSLLQSIIAVPTKKRGKDYLVVINGNNYAAFVDRGVSGTRRKYNSPFSFKKETVSPAFQKSLMKWISKVGVPIQSRYSQTRDLTKTQRKKAQIDEKSKMAYAMGVGIKRKGIEPTLFIQNAISEQVVNDYTQALSKALGKQITTVMTNNIKQWQ
jgi:hypothetical protein